MESSTLVFSTGPSEGFLFVVIFCWHIHSPIIPRLGWVCKQHATAPSPGSTGNKNLGIFCFTSWLVSRVTGWWKILVKWCKMRKYIPGDQYKRVYFPLWHGYFVIFFEALSRWASFGEGAELESLAYKPGFWSANLTDPKRPAINLDLTRSKRDLGRLRFEKSPLSYLALFKTSSCFGP